MRRANPGMIGSGRAGCRILEELLEIAPDLYRATGCGAERAAVGAPAPIPRECGTIMLFPSRETPA